MSKLAHLSVLQKVWFASITALVLLLAINAMQSYQAITELKDQEISSGTTKAKLRSAKEVFSSVQDAELHLLAYLISHKQHHLDLYFKSLERLDEHVSELKQLSYQLPQQTLDIQTLEQAILTRLDEMREDINPGNKKLNLERVLNSKVFTSQDSLSAIRSLLQEIESSEYALLDQQSLEAMSSRERLMATTTLATVLSLILVVLIAVLLYRAISKQQLEALHLEALVEQRTREIQVYSDELKRSNRELQDFAFVASHDLQEPLRKIRTFGDRLSSRYADKLGEGGIDYIARMQNAAQRMSTLIENLLAFSRVTTRAKEFESVDLNLLLADIMDDLQIAIEEKSAQIHHPDQLPTIQADASQIKQLLQNLISNALKFVAEGTSPVIQLSCNETESQIEIRIQDNGIGFEEQYTDRIFTPFQRLHGKDEYAGTGIGLAICRRIVERHGGTLTAISQPNEGATFIIELPKVPPKLTDINEELTHE